MPLSCGYAPVRIDPCARVGRVASTDGSLTMIICELWCGAVSDAVMSLNLRLVVSRCRMVERG